MDLTLIGHDDRYAVEQLQLSLFPQGQPGQAVSTLHRGKTWLTASTQITLDGKTVQASRRIPAAEETVRLRRRPGGFPPPKKPYGCAAGLCSRATIWLPASCCRFCPPGAPWPGFGPPN